MSEHETVFEMGQRVNVYDECEHFICVGAIDGIHHAPEPDGEEFYDVVPVGAPFARFHRISEMRLTDA